MFQSLFTPLPHTLCSSSSNSLLPLLSQSLFPYPNRCPSHSFRICPMQSLSQSLIPLVSVTVRSFLLFPALVVPVNVQFLVTALFLIFVPALSQSCSCPCHFPVPVLIPFLVAAFVPCLSSRCHCACSSGSPVPTLVSTLITAIFPMSLVLPMSFSVLQQFAMFLSLFYVKQSSPCSFLWTE
jgi:hypothetical protein